MNHSSYLDYYSNGHSSTNYFNKPRDDRYRSLADLKHKNEQSRNASVHDLTFAQVVR